MIVDMETTFLISGPVSRMRECIGFCGTSFDVAMVKF